MPSGHGKRLAWWAILSVMGTRGPLSGQAVEQVRQGNALAAPRGDQVVPDWIAVVDGLQLRRARRRRGLSQERLADRAGVSLTTIAKLERDPRPRCLTQTLVRLADALDEHPSVLSPQLAMGERQAAPPSAIQPCAQPDAWTHSQTFPGRTDQVRQARTFAARVLADCPVAADVVLICSELATNAILHSNSGVPGGHFTVRIQVQDGHFAWIEVEDQGGRWRREERSVDGGRGLAVVAALANYWDIRGDRAGRVTCARLDWPSEGPPLGPDDGHLGSDLRGRYWD
jgi:serine/threonine-protein kinase RsbW